MSNAAKALETWINDQTALEFWCSKVVGLFQAEEFGQCVVQKVSDTELVFLKPNGKAVSFTNPGRLIIEPCLASHMDSAYQLHIRTSSLTDWINLRPLMN